MLVEERGEAGNAASQLRVIMLLLKCLRNRFVFRIWDSMRAALENQYEHTTSLPGSPQSRFAKT